MASGRIRIDNLAVASIFLIFLLQGPIISICRALSSPFFSEFALKLIIDMLTLLTLLLAVAVTLPYRLFSSRVFALASSACFLSMMILLTIAFGDREVPFYVGSIRDLGWGEVNQSTWNTRTEELSRFIVIGLFYVLWISIDPSKTSLNLERLDQFGRVILKLVLVMLAVAILQSMHFLPNFYFQWVGNAHLPRPTGGMLHPHYFAALSASTIGLALFLNQRRAISLRYLFLYSASMVIAAIYSTSRIGLIISFINFSIVTIYSIRYSTRRTIDTLVISIVISVPISAIYFDQLYLFISNKYDVFIMSIAADQGDVTRGRIVGWETEFQVISQTTESLLFGQGYQQFVSHNLFLRQAQVSGLIGLILYCGIIVSLVVRALRCVAKRFRLSLILTVLPAAICTLYLPILVSLAINAGILCTWMFLMIASVDQKQCELNGAKKPRFSSGNLSLS